MVPFGFTNAPATFMCLMNNVFNKFMDMLALVLLDGILIYSKNEEEHVEHLRLTLKFPTKHKLYAVLRNYDFYEEEFIIWVTLSQIEEYLVILKRLRP